MRTTTQTLPGLQGTASDAGANVHPAYRADIDGLRAVAILSVVIFHAFPEALPGGFVGVDIFFVISGFLISSIIFRSLKRGNFSFADFYANRIRRIFPALIVVLAATCVASWFLLLPGEARQLGRHVAAGAGFVLNLVLWEEAGYFDTASGLKPLLHLWSLAIEEQFYLVYPLIIWGAWRIGLNLLGVVLLLCLASFAMNVLSIQVDISLAYFSPQTRFWELLGGAAVAHAHAFGWTLTSETSKAELEKWSRFRNTLFLRDLRFRADALSIAGGLMILTAFALTPRSGAFPGWWAVLPVSGAVLLILAGPQALVNRNLLSNGAVVLLGLISYPLYLWHWPMLSFAQIVESGSPSITTRVVMASASIVLAWLTYRFIERPIRSGSRTPGKTAALCSMLTFVAVAGYFTSLATDGLIRRPTQDAAQFIAGDGKEVFAYTPFPTSRVCREEAHQSICRDGKPGAIFIWGDSHASALYPGFNALQQIHPWIGITQWTGCGNPPFLSLGNFTDGRSCDSVSQRLNQNKAAVQMIASTHPSIVVLHSRWAYEHYHTSQQELVMKLRETAEAIQLASPTTKIVVLGPVPNWKTTLAREMFIFWRKSFSQQMPPDYMNSGLVPEIADWDAHLAREIPRQGISYVSAYKLLCNYSGCLTRVGPKPSDLTATDYGHLSPAGATYLVARMAPTLLELMGPPSPAVPMR